MYLWTAIDVSEQLHPLRRDVERISRELDLDNGALTLPFHISLRISCPIDDALYEQAVDATEAYLSSLSPFIVRVKGVHRNGDIIWCVMESNPDLEDLHKRLIDFMSADFGVGTHPFDRMFLYHATLFIGAGEKTEAAFARIRSARTPETLTANRFVIGASESGKIGEYRVIRRISVG